MKFCNKKCRNCLKVLRENVRKIDIYIWKCNSILRTYQYVRIYQNLMDIQANSTSKLLQISTITVQPTPNHSKHQVKSWTCRHMNKNWSLIVKLKIANIFSLKIRKNLVKLCINNFFESLIALIDFFHPERTYHLSFFPCNINKKFCLFWSNIREFTS